MVYLILEGGCKYTYALIFTSYVPRARSCVWSFFLSFYSHIPPFGRVRLAVITASDTDFTKRHIANIYTESYRPRRASLVRIVVCIFKFGERLKSNGADVMVLVSRSMEIVVTHEVGLYRV